TGHSPPCRGRGEPPARADRRTAGGRHHPGRSRRPRRRAGELALLRPPDGRPVRAAAERRLGVGRDSGVAGTEVPMDWHTRRVGLRIGAHRGDPESAPENTPAAFEAAVALGVDYVETDVQRTADGFLVLLHDDDLDRTTSGSGPVARASWEEV